MVSLGKYTNKATGKAKKYEHKEKFTIWYIANSIILGLQE